MGLVSCWPPGPQELAVQVQVIRDTDGGGTGFGVHGGGVSEGLPRTACTRRAIRPMPRYEVIRDPVVQAELTAKLRELVRLAATRKDTPGRQRGDHDNRGLFYRPEERQHDCPSVPLAALRIAHNSPTCRYGMTWTPPAKGGPLLGERRPEFASGNERTFGGRCVERPSHNSRNVS